MAFRFSLRAVLSMWESRERAERLRLEAIAAKILQFRHLIEANEQSSRTERTELNESLADGVAGSEVRYLLAREEGRTQLRKALQRQIGELEAQWETQHKVLMEARRQREILEKLRARQLQAYRLDQERRFQQQVDELFLLSRSREQSE
jgi:flagellar protein FliJ